MNVKESHGEEIEKLLELHALFIERGDREIARHVGLRLSKLAADGHADLIDCIGGCDNECNDPWIHNIEVNNGDNIEIVNGDNIEIINKDNIKIINGDGCEVVDAICRSTHFGFIRHSEDLFTVTREQLRLIRENGVDPIDWTLVDTMKFETLGAILETPCIL